MGGGGDKEMVNEGVMRNYCKTYLCCYVEKKNILLARSSGKRIVRDE